MRDIADCDIPVACAMIRVDQIPVTAVTAIRSSSAFWNESTKLSLTNSIFTW